MIKVYNTLTKKKETLETIEKNKVKMYVCGPTTYNYIHLGNARPVVVFDTIRRYLKFVGYEVAYVQNFTDIDDKIIKKAEQENLPPLEIAEKFIAEYFKDADTLNVKRADVHPRVSENIDEIIDMVENLISGGYAYKIDGDVYFSVSDYKDYGQLSGRTLEEMKAGARVEVDKRKKHPLDFALWKAAKPTELSWESPWGRGRPGWHIECSAMSLKYLGGNFDIHGGGQDLIFPHHENEMAQSKACAQCGFAKYWLHNGFITVNKEKMSKSLDNFFLLREILKIFPPDVVRFYLLSTHYRSPLDFSEDNLYAASKGLERLKNCQGLFKEFLEKRQIQTEALEEDSYSYTNEISKITKTLEKSFTEAMNDDFNTALALATLFDFVRDINGLVNNLEFKITAKNLRSLEESYAVFEKLTSDVLGIFFEIKSSADSEKDLLIEDLMKIIINTRQEARKEKRWDIADKLRDSLKEAGILLEDTPQGPKWKIDK